MKTIPIAVALCGCLLGASAQGLEITEKTFSASGIRSVVVEHAAGDVEIVAGAPNVMSVQTAQRPDHGPPVAGLLIRRAKKMGPGHRVRGPLRL